MSTLRALTSFMLRSIVSLLNALAQHAGQFPQARCHRQRRALSAER